MGFDNTLGSFYILLNFNFKSYNLNYYSFLISCILYLFELKIYTKQRNIFMFVDQFLKNAAARGSEVSAIIRDYIQNEKQISFNAYENYLP